MFNKLNLDLLEAYSDFQQSLEFKYFSNIKIEEIFSPLKV